MKLRVATYNVHGFVGADGARDVRRIVEVMRSLDADIVALQEVPLGPEEQVPSELLEGLDAVHAVAGAHERRDGSWLGNVILSRFPLESKRRIDLAFFHREPRSALEVVVATAAGPVRIVATHLGLRPAERRFQVQRILASIGSDQPAVVVVLGDFNEWFLMGRPLRWLHRRFGKSAALRTYPATFPLFALDRVWVQPPEVLSSVRAVTTPLIRVASDHLPVVGELRLTPSRP